MVDHPDPDSETPGGYDRGSDGMPERTRRAFQSHYDTQLDPSGIIGQTIDEIERVFGSDPDAVVACSGGKDSLTTVVLADEADAEHRALHWDWGGRLVPRDLEREIVSTIRSYVPEDRLFVAGRHPDAADFERYSAAESFQRYLREHDGIMDADGSLDRYRGALRRCDAVGTQVLGLRAGESGKRERAVSGGLFGDSMGLRSAFPIREWSARDVWAFLVDRGVDYPSYYDRVAHVGNASPADYEAARLSTIHDPEFERLSNYGHTSWRDRDITQKSDD